MYNIIYIRFIKNRTNLFSYPAPVSIKVTCLYSFPSTRHKTRKGDGSFTCSKLRTQPHKPHPKVQITCTTSLPLCKSFKELFLYNAPVTKQPRWQRASFPKASAKVTTFRTTTKSLQLFFQGIYQQNNKKQYMNIENTLENNKLTIHNENELF